jgi:hypothetical protein
MEEIPMKIPSKHHMPAAAWLASAACLAVVTAATRAAEPPAAQTPTQIEAQVHQAQPDQSQPAASVSTPTPSPAGTTSGRQAGHTYVLVFERLSKPLDDNPLRRRWQLKQGMLVRSWVDHKLQPDDRVAIALYHRRLTVAVDLTGDRAALDAAVDNIVTGGHVTRAAATAEGRSLVTALRQLHVPRNLPAGDSLIALANAAAGLPPPVHLVFFSPLENQDLDYGDAASALAQRLTALGADLWVFEPGEGAFPFPPPFTDAVAP